jgi:hypothetical protein
MKDQLKGCHFKHAGEIQMNLMKSTVQEITDNSFQKCFKTAVQTLAELCGCWRTVVQIFEAEACVNVIKNSVHTSKKTLHFTVIKICLLMVLRK